MQNYRPVSPQRGLCAVRRCNYNSKQQNDQVGNNQRLLHRIQHIKKNLEKFHNPSRSVLPSILNDFQSLNDEQYSLNCNIRLILEGRRRAKPEGWRVSDARFYPSGFRQLPTNFEQLYRTNEKVEKIRRRWEFLVENIQRQRFQLLRAEHATFAWFPRRNYGHFEISWGEAWRSIHETLYIFIKCCRNYIHLCTFPF